MNAKQGVYRLCSRVDPNGFGAGKGSHVSVSCTLMKGEHDNVLPWPIEADITVEMLNWTENKNNIRHTISLSHGADGKAASAVLISGVAEKYYGAPTLAPHSSLPHNATTNKQYLNQGCLLFKIDSFHLYADRASAARLPPWVDPKVGSAYPCFTVSEFSKRREFKNCCYGKPFFSHRNGYKMQIRVNASKGQNVGVFLFLMLGPNDHQLQWPFQGDVAIELVNWQEDKGHHSKVVSLSPKCTNAICNRVVNGDRSSDCWGYSEFVSHATLPYNPTTNTEYLQNDSLHFRVKEVVVFSSPSLWRTPIWQTRVLNFQFTVNDFTKRRSMENQFYSPAFYTHSRGYKLRLEVKVNEEAKAISVYARLLKGENDAALSWPLIGDICVELLNWREDRNHHSRTIDFHERVCAKYGNRVENGESSDNSYGYSSFISCSSLGYNYSTNTEYMNGDCLCFRVSKIAAYSSPLTSKIPWWQPRDQPASFTITDIPLRRRMDNQYYSPPFYVSKYKMCLNVYVNGSGSQKGKQISMYACLLKGEHDDELEWPYRGDITVEVLNWRGDHDHFKNVLSLDEYDTYTTRVMNDSSEPGGSGTHSFMTISQSNTYLDEQCLRMRVHSTVSYNGPLRQKSPAWQGSIWNSVVNPASMNSHIDFTITGFSSHLANKTRYNSPPFYTHNRGYKMRLEVDAYGTGKGAGHMSVYARLMAGEYDSSLKWPMKVDLTVEMLNWVRNSFHVLKIIKFGENRDSCSRVSAEEKTASSSWGFATFCPHTTIFGKRHSVEYVQEDCVRMRVKGAIIHSTKVLGLF